MKIVNYSRLNQKNKSRIDAVVKLFENRPSHAHHTVTATPVTKYVRSMVTVCNPKSEIELVAGGRVITTQIALDS